MGRQMNKPKYKVGDKVWIENLDFHGFLGRMLQPHVRDEGEEGWVLSTHFEWDENEKAPVDSIIHFYTVAIPGEYPLDGGNKNIQARLVNLVEHESQVGSVVRW